MEHMGNLYALIMLYIRFVLFQLGDGYTTYLRNMRKSRFWSSTQIFGLIKKNSVNNHQLVYIYIIYAWTLQGVPNGW